MKLIISCCPIVDTQVSNPLFANSESFATCFLLSSIRYLLLLFFSLQSYHDPDSEEEDVRLASEIVAGASVTSGQEVSPPEEEKQTPRDTLEGEEKEDLPEQPPPVEEKPKEGKEYNFSSNTNCSSARKTKT